MKALPMQSHAFCPNKSSLKVGEVSLECDIPGFPNLGFYPPSRDGLELLWGISKGKLSSEHKSSSSCL